MNSATAVQVREHPILFSGPMVRAILEGRKTQTRRVITPQPERDPFPCPWVRSGWALSDPWEHGVACTCREIRFPYASRKSDGRPDQLWVRETFSAYAPEGQEGNWKTGENVTYVYRADDENADVAQWYPSIFLPRIASRIALEITDVRAERLQEISQEDIAAEGFRAYSENARLQEIAREDFANGWNKLNAKRGYSWESNPWVWVIEFPLARTLNQ